MIVGFAVAAYLGVLLLYGTASYFYVMMFVRERELDKTWATRTRNAGVLIHALFILLIGVKYRELPLVTIQNFLSMVALSIVLVHSIIEKRARITGTGGSIVALALILHLSAFSSIKMEPPVHEFLQSPVFAVHVVFAVLGYAGFTLSALYGVMYLLQFRALKRMRFGPLFKNLPALDFLGRMNLDSAITGVICLTLSIVLGLLLSVKLEQPFLTDAKFLQAVVAWLVYALLVVGRYAFRWSGRTLVQLSLASFAVFVGSLVVVAAFFQTFHSFS